MIPYRTASWTSAVVYKPETQIYYSLGSHFLKKCIYRLHSIIKTGESATTKDLVKVMATSF